ncbi:hypothetical protein EMIT0P265_460001 [Pseudomonas zeae]
MPTNDRNNPRTLEGIHEKIRAIANAKSLAQAQFDHAYQLGWIGALYWADIIDLDMRNQLTAEVADALKALWLRVWVD